MCKKSTIFLPAGINLFKVITTDFEQIFAYWDSYQTKFNLDNSFQTKDLYHTGIEQKLKNLMKIFIRACARAFLVSLRMLFSGHLPCLLSYIFDA